MRIERILNRKNLLFSFTSYVSSFLPFLITLLLAKYYSKVEFGSFAYFMIGFNISSVLSQYGTDKTLIIELSHNEDDGKTITENTHFKSIIAITINIFISIVNISFYKFRFFELNLLQIGVLSGSIYAISPRQWFDYKKEHLKGALIILYDRLIYTVLSVFFILMNFSKISLLLGLSWLLGRVFSFVIELKNIIRWRPSEYFLTKEKIIVLLKGNFFVWLAAIGNIAMTQLNQLILGYNLGLSSLAVFAFAFQIINLVRLGQRQFLRLFVRDLSDITKKPNGQKIIETLKLYILYSAITSIIIGSIIMSVFPVINEYLLSNKYTDSLPSLRILLIWMVFLGISLGLNQIILGLNLKKTYFQITTSFGLLSLFLCFYLTQAFHEKGAALSLLISHFLSILIQIIIVFKFIKKNNL